MAPLRTDRGLGAQCGPTRSTRSRRRPARSGAAAVVRSGGRWVAAAWAAALVEEYDGQWVLRCCDIYERGGFRGTGLYPAAYALRHRAVVEPSPLRAVTYKQNLTALPGAGRLKVAIVGTGDWCQLAHLVHEPCRDRQRKGSASTPVRSWSRRTVKSCSTPASGIPPSSPNTSPPPARPVSSTARLAPDAIRPTRPTLHRSWTGGRVADAADIGLAMLTGLGVVGYLLAWLFAHIAAVLAVLMLTRLVMGAFGPRVCKTVVNG
jgi:hypothetical protein